MEPSRRWTRRTARVVLAVLCAGGCAQAQRPGAAPDPSQVELQLLAFNDFHGRLLPSGDGGQATPGAVALVAALVDAMVAPERALVVEAGDLFGASGPEAALLREEPAVAALSCLCPPGKSCPAVGAIGNHELDHGLQALRRVLSGDATPPAPVFTSPWPGASYPTLCANLRDRATGATIFPARAVRELAGVRVGLIGAVTRRLPWLVSRASLAGLEVEDEATAVNREVRGLRAEGVGVIVVLLHEGVDEQGRLAEIVRRLDPAVDLVVSGHTHREDEERLPSSDPAHAILVTQAGRSGVAFHDVRLEVDSASGRVVSARTRLVRVRPRPASAPLPEAARCVAGVVALAAAAVAPILDRRVAVAEVPIPRRPGPTGEVPAAELVADAFRAALGADVGLVNAGGVREGFPAGPLTVRQLLLALPFRNTLCTVTLTGGELHALLERQRSAGGMGLQASGLTYAWDATAPAGARASHLQVGDAPVGADRRYTVATVDFLVNGGDGFRELATAPSTCQGQGDAEAVETWLQGLPQPVGLPAGDRVR